MSVVSGRLGLGELERRLLVAGAAAFGLSLDAASLDRFSQFADLLGLWSARMNLISCHTARELVERHLLDSLAVGPWIRDAATIVDLGSGAGFPGVPLAIALVEKRLILVEPRRRRANFLREVKRTLGLVNVQIVETRAEDGIRRAHLPLADAVVCRAVWAEESVLGFTSAWLRPSGTLIRMRGTGAKGSTQSAGVRSSMRRGTEKPTPEERSSAKDMVVERSVTYRIGTGHPRTLDICRRHAED